MEYSSDAPRREIHGLVAPSKIESPVDHAYPSGNDCVQPSAPSVSDSRENGHADPGVPIQPVKHLASDCDEKSLSSTVLPRAPVASVVKFDCPTEHKPIDPNTAAAEKAFESEDELNQKPKEISTAAAEKAFECEDELDQKPIDTSVAAPEKVLKCQDELYQKAIVSSTAAAEKTSKFEDELDQKPICGVELDQRAIDSSTAAAEKTSKFEDELDQKPSCGDVLDQKAIDSSTAAAEKTLKFDDELDQQPICEDELDQKAIDSSTGAAEKAPKCEDELDQKPICEDEFDEKPIDTSTAAPEKASKCEDELDQKPIDLSTAAAEKASKCEDELDQKPIDTRTAAELESRLLLPEAIDQPDRAESDLLNSRKRDFEEPEPIADRGFEPSPEAVDQIIPSEGPEQRDLQELDTDVTDIRQVTAIEARGSDDPIDHVPEETVATSAESMSVAAKDDETPVEAATSVPEQKEVKDGMECHSVPSPVAMEGDFGSNRQNQDPDATPEVDKDEAAVPRQIPGVDQTVDERTTCKAEDPKTDGDEVLETFASQSTEVDSRYSVDDCGKEESPPTVNIVDERSCSFDSLTLASDDKAMATKEKSAPAEQNVTETPFDAKKKEGDAVIEPSASQTLAPERSFLLSDPVKEVEVAESAGDTKHSDEMSCGIDEATPAAIHEKPEEEFAEPDQISTSAEENASETTYNIESAPKSVRGQTQEDDSVIEPPPSQSVEVEERFQLADESVKVEEASVAESEDAIGRSCKIESPPAADNEKTDECVELEKSAPTEENGFNELLHNVDESTPAVSHDYHQTKEDGVLEASTPQILEVDRISHCSETTEGNKLQERTTDDEIEGNHLNESTPAGACDAEFVQKLDNLSSPVTAENVSETSSRNIESTHPATDCDQIKERFTEAVQQSVHERSYTESGMISSSCDDQRAVNQEERKHEKTNQREAREDEIKSGFTSHSDALRTVEQTEGSYSETVHPDSKEMLNIRTAQSGIDSSFPADSKEEGIELPTLDSNSHKTKQSAPRAPQAGREDTTERELAVSDGKTHRISEDGGASKVEVEHAAGEPHRASFLGKLIDKVTGKK